jgi:GTP cyclohydrolase I
MVCGTSGAKAPEVDAERRGKALALPMMADDSSAAAVRAVRLLLRAIGEDPDRDELEGTPERVAKMLMLLCSGTSQAPGDVLEGAVSSECTEGMVVVKDIPFRSVCERHLIPFLGRAHVAYLPRGRALDCSRLPRLLDVLARRLQSQERLTDQIARAVQSAIEPRGVAVRLGAHHLCRVLQGVERQESVVMTSAFLGDFERDLALRHEFHAALGADLGPRREEWRVTIDRPEPPPEPGEAKNGLEGRVGVFNRHAPPVPRGTYPQRIAPRPGRAAGAGR